VCVVVLQCSPPCDCLFLVCLCGALYHLGSLSVPHLTHSHDASDFSRLFCASTSDSALAALVSPPARFTRPHHLCDRGATDMALAGARLSRSLDLHFLFLDLGCTLWCRCDASHTRARLDALDDLCGSAALAPLTDATASTLLPQPSYAHPPPLPLAHGPVAAPLFDRCWG
jgi:hypothetical protein